MHFKLNFALFPILLFFFTTSILPAQSETSVSGRKQKDEVDYFLDIVTSSNKETHRKAINYISKNWEDAYEIMILELMYFSSNSDLGVQLALLLQRKTGQDFGLDFNAWYEWLWNKPQKLTPYYHDFKGKLHSYIDNRFRKYFTNRQESSSIRFDEIRWGGVRQDGIPPLRNPKMIAAKNARYLDDNNIVFGIEVNGDARAYPKRILAWHEMFVDDVGGIPVTGVYCTLCGTVILYESIHNGVKYNFGTSGFLYRSNKLMYDKATQSLWNTHWGKPVVGPLVGKNIELNYRSVVTTTWGEWKKRHPNTKVLSLQTGHRRDYGEGIAYKDYFATDELMFNVPRTDQKLKHKQSILAIKLPEYPGKELAISVKFLKKNPLYSGNIDNTNFVVLTDKTGANRVYETKGNRFTNFDQNNTVTDQLGGTWTLYENRLEHTNGKTLLRIPTYNAFWFGWKAAYPDTKLIK